MILKDFCIFFFGEMLYLKKKRHLDQKEACFVRFSSFADLLRHQAQAIPEQTALLWGAEPRPVSYRALNDTVLARAEDWRDSGKTCLGVFCDGSFECVCTVFAANLAGLQVVLLDENAPDEQLPGLMAYTDIDALWGDEDLVEELTPYLTRGPADGRRPPLQRDSQEEGNGRILFFTSGTTESAKAVVLTDASLCASAWNGGEKLPLLPEDRLLCMLPLNHVFGFVCGLLWGLSCGATVALGRGMRHYLDDFAHFRPTAVSLVPLLLGFLLPKGAINRELRLVLVGAGDCPPPLLAAAAAHGLTVSFGYGLTETSSGVAISVKGDPFAMEVCPDDTVTLAEDGEILIQAPTCMMKGYYKKPEDTAAVLQDGVLHTGDLGRWDAAGLLHIVGRKKEMLVLPDGTKLFLPEYEAELAALLGTRELALALRNGSPVLVLSAPPEDKTALLQRLTPATAKRPRGQQIRDIIFINEPLPRTATGKLQRWALQNMLEDLL